jgi:hypothetical protein
MAYVGNVPAVAYTNTVKDTFSGDGSTVAFTMSLPSTTNNVRVVVENVIQDPTVAYSVSGTTLTFTSAPPAGTDNIYVVHLGPAVQTVQPPTELSGNFTLTGDLAQTGDYTLTGAASVSGGSSNNNNDANTIVATGTNHVRLKVHTPTTGGFQASLVLSSDETLTSTGNEVSISTAGSDEMRFATGGSERARIDASGDLLVGTTSIATVIGNQTGLELRGSAGVAAFCADSESALFLARRGNNGAVALFRRDTTQVGSISVTTTNTAYNTSSDYRLKEDVQPMVGASDRLMALKPCNFAWKVDGSRVDGFLAHEAQEVVPECVTGEKDQVQIVEIKDEDGNVTGTEEQPVYQGIDQSKIVPLLVAALQEAMAEIAELKADVAALKGA